MVEWRGGGGLGWTSQKKSLPRLVGTMPDPHSRDVGKKAASHWVEVAGGAGVDKTTHSPPFFPRLELEEEKEGEEGEEEGGAEKELKRRRRRLRISGGSVRLGRTKIARSIQESQPAPAFSNLFRCCRQLLLPPRPKPSTDISRRPIFLLSPKLVTIVSRQTAHWLRTSSPLVTSWSGPDA